MRYAVFAYAALAGVLTSSVTDFILCAVPLLAVMFYVERPRPFDVFIFTPAQSDLADMFAEHVLEDSDEYDNARIFLIDTDRLRDEVDKGR